MNKYIKKNHKIVFYIPWEFDLLGGVDVVVDRLQKQLSDRGDYKCFIGIQSWEKGGEFIDDVNRHFLYLNLPQPPCSKLVTRWVRYFLSAVKHGAILAHILWSERIKIFNAHFPTQNLIIIAMLRYLKIWKGRIVLSFHGKDVRDLDGNSKIWRIISSQVESCTTCSKTLSFELKQFSFFHDKPIYVAYNGIDIQSFSSLMKYSMYENIIDCSIKYIINIGNFVERKGQDILLNSFERICRQNTNIDLVLIGGKVNGFWLNKLQKLSEDLKIQNRVKFVVDAPHESIPSFLRNAICMVHTARQEPFGLVLIEAGALGVPVIATRVGGIPEIICHLRNGILIPADDIDATEEWITYILNNTDKAMLLGRELKNTVEYRFSTESMTDMYMIALGLIDR